MIQRFQRLFQRRNKYDRDTVFSLHMKKQKKRDVEKGICGQAETGPGLLSPNAGSVVCLTMLFLH